MYMSYQLLRNLQPGDMSAAEQRAADEQQGRTAAAIAESWQRTAERARAAAGLLPLLFRNRNDRLSPQRACPPPPGVRAAPEKVAKSQLNGHAVR
jgi:hypothetical protein